MAKIGRQVFHILESKGIYAHYQDVLIIKPIKMSNAAALRGRTIAVIEDNVVTGGFGQSLHANLGTDKKVLTFGWPDSFIEQGTFEELTDKYGLSAEKIAERICEALERKA